MSIDPFAGKPWKHIHDPEEFEPTGIGFGRDNDGRHALVFKSGDEMLVVPIKNKRMLEMVDQAVANIRALWAQREERN